MWALAAAAVGNGLLLASPADALASLAAQLRTAEFWQAVAISGGRIVAAACASALLGALLGFLSARFRVAERLLVPPLQVMKSAPVACVAVVLLVSLGASNAVWIIVAFVALPPFYAAAREAKEQRDRDTERVLALMGTSRWQIFMACTWQAALPFFRAAARTAFALSWRAGVTAELLGVPLGSIGAAVYMSKLTLDSAGLLAWMTVVMLLGWLSERLAAAILDLSGKAALRAALARRTGVAGVSAVALEKERAVEGAAETSSSEYENAAITCTNISKSYGDASVLENVSLAVSAGERVCLMAPTGAGKTTLVRIALGLETSDGGTAARPARAAVALQQATLLEDATALENVMVVAASRASEQEVRAALESLLPPNAVDECARNLSGGTRRLVEIARALFSAGACVVLDEPFAGLDAQARRRACAFILDNLHDRPLLVTTHNADDAALLNARIVTLSPNAA